MAAAHQDVNGSGVAAKSASENKVNKKKKKKHSCTKTDRRKWQKKGIRSARWDAAVLLQVSAVPTLQKVAV